MIKNNEYTIPATIGTLMVYLAITLISLPAMAEDTTRPLLANPENKQQVTRGKKVYMRFCAYCHGKQLEGQPNWFKPKADGKMPAPPHNENGHTWHHADIVLFKLTKYGMVPPNADVGYQSDMPAFEHTLKDEDIWAVLAFIKSRWPEENLKFQQEVNRTYKP